MNCAELGSFPEHEASESNDAEAGAGGTDTLAILDQSAAEGGPGERSLGHL